MSNRTAQSLRVPLSRRAFLGGAAATLAVLLGGCGPADASLKLSDFLVWEPQRCLAYLEEHQWEHNLGMAYWNLRTCTVGPCTGAGRIMLFGEPDGSRRRPLGPDRLTNGAPVKAVALLVEMEDGLPFTPLSTIAKMRASQGVSEGSLLAQAGHWFDCELEPYFGDDMFHPTYEVGAASVQNTPAVWTCTTEGQRFMAIGLSTLDYYARSQLIEPSYEAVEALPGPWDIDIQDDFRKSPA